MRKTLCIVAALALLAIPLLAQDHPKAEVFGGYQLTHINPGVTGTAKSESFNGFNAALTVWANGWLGITADFSGAYKSSTNLFNTGPGPNISAHQYTYMFGPTIASHHNEKYTPFGHFLIGGAKASANVGSGPFGVGTTASDNVLAFALGGGLDVNVTPHVAVRVGQFDYLRTRFFNDVTFTGNTGHQNDFRYSAGVVFKF